MPGDREKVVTLDADHSTVCKFGTDESDQDNLKLVQRNIKDMYEKALKSSESFAIPSLVPAKVGESSSLEARLAVLRGK